MTYKEVLSPEIIAFLEKAKENLLKFRREKAEGKSPTQILAEIITNPAAQVVLGIWPDQTQPLLLQAISCVVPPRLSRACSSVFE